MRVESGTIKFLESSYLLIFALALAARTTRKILAPKKTRFEKVHIQSTRDSATNTAVDCTFFLVSKTLSASSSSSQPLTTHLMPTRAASPSSILPVSKQIRLSPAPSRATAANMSSSSSLPRLLISLDPAHPKAKAPTRGSALAAGYDLYASEEATIPKQGRGMVPTGIRLAIPLGCYGRVAPRSGLALNHGIDTGAGVIDSDYRGLLGILLFNFGSDDFKINVGDRIAQLVLERIETPEVEVVESLDETDRGAGGFGSTGGFGPTAAAAIKEKSNGSA